MHILRISLFSVIALAAALPARSDLIHQYVFDGNADDQITTGGINGLLHGNATASGGILTLDGNGDYVTFASAILPGTGDFSLLFSAEFACCSRQEIFSQSGPGGKPFYIGPEGTELRLGDHYAAYDGSWNPTNNPDPLYNGAGGCGGACTGVEAPNDNAWHDYAFIVSSGTATFYIDGILRATFAGFDLGAGSSAIGQQYIGGEYLNGAVKNMLVYDNALSLQEIQAYGEAPEPGTVFLMGTALIGAALVKRRKRTA